MCYQFHSVIRDRKSNLESNHSIVVTPNELLPVMRQIGGSNPGDVIFEYLSDHDKFKCHVDVSAVLNSNIQYMQHI